MKKLREFGLDILYARAKTKLWERSSACAVSPILPWPTSELAAPQLPLAGICRQRHENQPGQRLHRTSNAFLAHKHDLEAIGTNAHEIPMVLRR